MTCHICASPTCVDDCIPEVKPLAHGHREDKYLLANCRLMLSSSRAWKGQPNWAIASHLFATGSTSARQICVDAGIDPDAKEVRL